MGIAAKGPTALASWMKNLAVELNNRGLPASALFAECGLDPALMDEPEARYSVDATTRLWHKAVELTQDEALGLKVIRHVAPASFHAVGLSVMASETLEQAFQRMSQFVDLITDASRIVLNTEIEGTYAVEFHLKHGALPATQSVDGFMALIANAGRGLGEAQLKPLYVELARAKPSETFLPVFERAFDAPLTFNNPTPRIIYSTETVRHKLRSGNPMIAAHLDQASAAALERMRPEAGLADRVKIKIAEMLSQQVNPSPEELAVHFNMSARNLQRKLADEGTSVANLVEDYKKSESLRRLKHTKDPITAIALDLGFSDNSAFSRACKRWFGQAPSDLRNV